MIFQLFNPTPIFITLPPHIPPKMSKQAITCSFVRSCFVAGVSLTNQVMRLLRSSIMRRTCQQTSTGCERAPGSRQWPARGHVTCAMRNRSRRLRHLLRVNRQSGTHRWSSCAFANGTYDDGDDDGWHVLDIYVIYVGACICAYVYLYTFANISRAW